MASFIVMCPSLAVPSVYRTIKYRNGEQRCGSSKQLEEKLQNVGAGVSEIQTVRVTEKNT
jgi:hypothetical protein